MSVRVFANCVCVLRVPLRGKQQLLAMLEVYELCLRHPKLRKYSKLSNFHLVLRPLVLPLVLPLSLVFIWLQARLSQFSDMAMADSELTLERLISDPRYDLLTTLADLFVAYRELQSRKRAEAAEPFLHDMVRGLGLDPAGAGLAAIWPTINSLANSLERHPLGKSNPRETSDWHNQLTIRQHEWQGLIAQLGQPPLLLD